MLKPGKQLVIVEVPRIKHKPKGTWNENNKKERRNEKMKRYLGKLENKVIHNFNSRKPFKVSKKELKLVLLECMILRHNLYEYIKGN